MACWLLRMHVSLTSINSIALHCTMSDFTVTLPRFRRRPSHPRLPMRSFISLSMRLHWLLSILALTSHSLSFPLCSVLVKILMLLTMTSMIWVPNALSYLMLILHFTLLLFNLLLLNSFSMLLHSLLVSKFIKFVPLITFLLLHVGKISFKVVSVSIKTEWLNFSVGILYSRVLYL